MNSRERVLTALDHKEPDRIPIHNFLTPEVLENVEELTNTRGFDAEIAAGNDWLIYTIGVCANFYLKPVHEYVDEWNITWRRVPHQGGIYTEMVNHPLSNLKSYDNYTFPDPHDKNRYKGLKNIIKKYKKDYVIVGGIPCTLFENAWYLRGMENWLIDLIENKDFVNDLLDRLMDFYIECGKILIDSGVDIIWTGDDFGMQDRMFIRKEQFKEFFKPRYAKIYSELKKKKNDIKFAHHTDGYVEPIIQDFIDIGLDILNPIQPQCMDPVEINRKYGKKLSFWGTVDNQYTLPFGSEDELYDELKRLLKYVAPGGGFIIGGAHCIQPTPVHQRNTFNMVEFIKKYGNYPINF
jgi:uroporphyrinogen decarboxylase